MQIKYYHSRNDFLIQFFELFHKNHFDNNATGEAQI